MFVVDKYLEEYTMYKEDTKAMAEDEGKWYYLVLQYCPQELKTELNKLARWVAVTIDTDVVALILIIQDVMSKKGAGLEYHGSGREWRDVIYNNNWIEGHPWQILHGI